MKKTTHANCPRLSQDYSLYLDCTRFFAALFVVFSHCVQYGFIDKAVSYYIPDLGREAVMIFFVLSGYVIAYTCDLKRPSLSDYAIARAARIYSVAFPVLILTFGLSYGISVFTGETHYQLSKMYIYIPLHSLFLGELWNIAEKPIWLVPYWSLSYEVWYYIFFASLYFFSGLKRVLIAGVIFSLLGHKLWLLLPIWLSGVALYHHQHHLQFSQRTARLGWFFTIALLSTYKFFDIDQTLRVYGNEIWPFASLTLGSADRYLSDYLITLMVLVNFLCAKHANFVGLARYKSIIRTVSSYTFTLYLVHALVISLWREFYPFDPTSIIDITLLLSAIGIATYLFGHLTEHRKHWFHNAFTWLYESTLGRRAALLKRETFSKS
jgi:peptidoglycan/LPS O-acetylase OafA/YrhL